MEQEHATLVVKPVRVPWNKGKLVGAKPPLRPSHVWSIRTKLQIEGKKRDLDAPPRASRGTLDIALRVDLVVQPSGPGIDDLDPAILLFHELSRAGIADAKLVIALTRVASRREEDLARKYVEKAGYTVLPGSMLERPAYREAHNRGLSLAEVPDLDQRSQDLLRGLLAMIVDRVKVRMHGVDRARKRTGRKA